MQKSAIPYDSTALGSNSASHGEDLPPSAVALPYREAGWDFYKCRKYLATRWGVTDLYGAVTDSENLRIVTR